MKTKVGLASLLLLLSLTAAAEGPPVRLVLGSDQPEELQHLIREDGEGYILHLGKKTDVLKQAFPHVPYPVEYFEVRIPRKFCASMRECATKRRAVTVRERTITGMEQSFQADVAYRLSFDFATNTYRLDVKFEGKNGTRKFSATFAESAISSDIG